MSQRGCWLVADADIIPIGGKGAAGRGSRTSPSAAARALAPSTGRRRASSATTGTAAPTVGPVKPAKAANAARAAKAAKAVKTANAANAAKAAKGANAAKSTAENATGPAVRRRRIDPPRVVEPLADESLAAETRVDGTLVDETLADEIVADADERGDGSAAVGSDRELDRRLAELLAFVRRRITGDYEVDEFGFDAEITERFLMSTLRPIANRWFRVEARGVDNIPAEGGALLVSNHSGTLPLDGLMTSLVVHDSTARTLRSLGADLVFKTPFIGELARKGGATLACNEDAERMLTAGELVGVWPEGFKGLGKPFSERYKLQRFGRGGFVSAALRVGVPIIPCSVVGAEEIYPMIANLPTLARLLGLPYLPVTPFFPLLGPLGLLPLPSKWLIEFGEPIRTDQLGDGAADDPMLVFNVTDQVRETIQQTLYSLLMQRRGVFS
jgi:1-acyl-sn-glycerol-3-phosphate acyltransferase